MRYILREFPTYSLPPEALIEVRNLSFPEAARWAHTGDGPIANLINPRSAIAHLSRSFAPPMKRDARPVRLCEGDEILILAASRSSEPKSTGDLRYTWVRVRKISDEAG